MTEVFGRSPSYWNRLECSLGRSSLVGTTVSSPELLPRHLVADEKHTTLGGEKVYLAATAGGGCCLGLALAKTAGADDLTDAYGVFREEAHRLDPTYRPATVNTDGWPATQAAWRALFKGVTLILCFLQAFLKYRDRAVHMKETFTELSRRVWEAYHPRMPGRSPAAPVAADLVGSERGHAGRAGEGAVAVRQAKGVRVGVPTPAVIARATWSIGCYGGSTTTRTVAIACEARRRLLIWDCVAGH